MSVVKVQGNASGTGIFTVAAPATNTDRTLTLPDQTGTILSTDSSGAAVLPRVDSTNEGGQINFNRASDNTAVWAIDSFGSNSTPTLRIINGATVAAAIDGSNNFQFNSGYGSSATAYGCRAWVNFNGTGTVAIRASGNVSSITDNGVGNYTVNISTAMPDINYTVNATTGASIGSDWASAVQMFTNTAIGRVAPTTSAFSFVVLNKTAGAYIDPTDVLISVFR